MIENISSFYKEVVAPVQIYITPQGKTTRIIPLKRIDFVGGSGLAILFLVQKIALSCFFLVASIFRCFNSENSRDSFFQNVQGIPTYLGAIPLGYIGAIIPQTINERVLHIPDNGLIIYAPLSQ